jgi:hypothetical protein
MSQAAGSLPHHMQRLTADEVQYLADRLYGRGVSKLSTDETRARADLILASRTLRALLAAYELAAGHPLAIVIVCGEAADMPGRIHPNLMPSSDNTLIIILSNGNQEIERRVAAAGDNALATAVMMLARRGEDLRAGDTLRIIRPH